MITTQILADSIHPASPSTRLTTYLLKYPRFIHSEFMTHRAISKNAASSRAIPVTRTLTNLEDDCVEFWGKNGKGMKSLIPLAPRDRELAEYHWTEARYEAIKRTTRMNELGVHKGIANRVVEPFNHITVIATGSTQGWANFFYQRCSEDPQPEFQVLAYRMLHRYLQSVPHPIRFGEWHMPMADTTPMWINEMDDTDRLKICTGRIARISYLTHDGRREYAEDIRLHDTLALDGHWSPFEHCAQCVDINRRDTSSNFGKGWLQYRKIFPNEFRSAFDRQAYLERLANAPAWIKIEENTVEG